MFTITARAVLFFLFGFLASCTAESKVKKSAVEGLKQAYTRQIEFEAKNRIYKDSVFKESYRAILSEKIELEVLSVEMNETKAKVKVQQQAPPFEVRRVLIDIINRNREANSASFNVSDALRLIQKQMQVPPAGKSEIYRVQLELIKDEWMVTKKTLEP